MAANHYKPGEHFRRLHLPNVKKELLWKKTKEVGGATDNLSLESDNQVYISESSLSLGQNSDQMESSMKSKHSPAQIHKDFKQTSNKSAKN